MAKTKPNGGGPPQRKRAGNAAASTTSPKKGKKQPAVVSPAAAETVGMGSYCVVYVMNDGRRHGFDNESDAMEFKVDYGDIVENTVRFNDVKSMKEFLSAAPTPSKSTPAGVEVIDVDNLSPDDKKKLSRITAAIEESKPTPSICCYWQTTRMSHKCIVVLLAYDSNGRGVWFFKSPLHRVLKGYFASTPTDHSAVNEFFMNMSTVAQRDPNGGQEDKLKTFNEAGDKEYVTLIFHSSFTLPVANLNSADQEKQFIEMTITETMERLRHESKTPVFNMAMKQAFSPNMHNAMMKEDACGGNFSRFVKDYRVKIHHCPNLNKCVVLADVKTLKMVLFDSGTVKKYPGADTLTDAVVEIKTEKQDSKPSPRTAKPPTKRNAKPKTKKKAITATEAQEIQAAVDAEAEVLQDDDDAVSVEVDIGDSHEVDIGDSDTHSEATEE